MECTCHNEFFDSSNSGDSDSKTLLISESFSVSDDAQVLDFGEVPVGKEAIRVLKLRNDSVSW